MLPDGPSGSRLIEVGTIRAGFLQAVLLAAFVLPGSAAQSVGGQGVNSVPVEEIVIRGRVVCVDAGGDVTGCRSAEARFAIDGPDGKRYFFLPEDQKVQMFRDERVRDRLLEIKAWKRGADRIEIVKIYSVHEGKLFDIYFYCDLCKIRAFAGGPCWCCQQEFELREDPVP